MLHVPRLSLLILILLRLVIIIIISFFIIIVLCLTIFVLECVLATLDMHWMLVSLIRKVVPPYDIFGDKLS